MDFRPAWDDDSVHQGELVQQLEKKGISIYPPCGEDFRLPYGFMTYGCAKWAIGVNRHRTLTPVLPQLTMLPKSETSDVDGVGVPSGSVTMPTGAS